MINKRDCSGCPDNYYGSGCWHFGKAKLVPTYSIHKDTPMSGYKEAWEKAGKKPSCYHGEHGMIYIKKESYDLLR